MFTLLVFLYGLQFQSTLISLYIRYEAGVAAKGETVGGSHTCYVATKLTLMSSFSSFVLPLRRLRSPRCSADGRARRRGEGGWRQTLLEGAR
jgi:hypothetical protein